MPIILLFIFSLLACSGYDREEFRMEVNKKYALQEFPDSLYLDTLDKFLASEYVRPQKQKVEMTMNSDFQLPQKQKGEAYYDKKYIEDLIDKAVKEGAAKNAEKNANASEEKKEASFAEKFVESLGALTENPSNEKFGMRVNAKGGENLNALLIRIYGSRANAIPKILAENQLKALNPNTDFSSLEEGEKILLPRI